MHRSGSQIGIFVAMVRFSKAAVPVGNAPSTGSALTGRRSPSPAIIRPVTRATNSGTCSGTGGRRCSVEVATSGTGTWCSSAVAASMAARLRSTTTAPRLP